MPAIQQVDANIPAPGPALWKQNHRLGHLGKRSDRSPVEKGYEMPGFGKKQPAFDHDSGEANDQRGNQHDQLNSAIRIAGEQ